MDERIISSVDSGIQPLVHYYSNAIGNFHAVVPAILQGSVTFRTRLQPDIIKTKFVTLLEDFLGYPGRYDEIHYFRFFGNIRKAGVTPGTVDFFQVRVYRIDLETTAFQISKDLEAKFVRIIGSAHDGEFLFRHEFPDEFLHDASLSISITGM
jgi:hypothetical protein